MALPVIRSALECADYHSTVAPYYHQLQPLPQVFFQSLTNLAGLKQLYLDTNPLVSSFAFALAITPIFLVVSEVNKNYSQVDRVWSILPTIYNIHYFVYGHMAGLDTTRLNALAIASTIWSTRLTYNYWRKGGYTVGSEDYRWAIVKEKVGPGLFFIFNILFVSLAQSVLLWSITTPSYILLLASRLSLHSGSMPSVSIADIAAPMLMVAFVGVTYAADQQQWDYYNARTEYRKFAKVPIGYEQEDLDRGFNTKGLFAISRHPNFASEQCIWVTLYLWGCYVSGTWANWTGVGALSYLFLFQSSTWLTELLSAGKYPEYKDYQRQVGKFMPKIGAGPVQFTRAVGSKTSKAQAHSKETGY